MVKSFQDMVVWQKAHELTLDIYKMTRTFPSDERFCLVPQMRRAAVSIAANIAEGFAKKGKRDKANFYNIAQGSLEETKYYLLLSKDLGYVKNIERQQVLADEVGKMLNRLIDSMRNP